MISWHMRKNHCFYGYIINVAIVAKVKWLGNTDNFSLNVEKCLNHPLCTLEKKCSTLHERFRIASNLVYAMRYSITEYYWTMNDPASFTYWQNPWASQILSCLWQFFFLNSGITFVFSCHFYFYPRYMSCTIPPPTHTHTLYVSLVCCCKSLL